MAIGNRFKWIWILVNRFHLYRKKKVVATSMGSRIGVVLLRFTVKKRNANALCFSVLTIWLKYMLFELELTDLRFKNYLNTYNANKALRYVIK